MEDYDFVEESASRSLYYISLITVPGLFHYLRITTVEANA